jgi:hypothetical protein
MIAWGGGRRSRPRGCSRRGAAFGPPKCEVAAEGLLAEGGGVWPTPDQEGGPDSEPDTKPEGLPGKGAAFAPSLSPNPSCT